MHQQLAIWCPVVITSLASPRTFRQNNSYQMAESYRRIEDIKVRIKACRSQVHGKYVETKVGVAWLCLLEDDQGRSCTIKREEVLKDKIALREFDQLADHQQELRYVQDISDFSWDADLKGKSVIISYKLSYRLMGTREQLVSVQTSHEQASIAANTKAKFPPADGQIDLLTEENLKLRRQLHFYETNLTSLKRGIKKAEKDNSALSMELRGYKNQVEALRNTVNYKDGIIGSSLTNKPLPNREAKKLWSAHESDKLGQRIKKLFINNL